MYEIQVDENTLEFVIKKDGEVLPFSECKNIEWGLQSMLAVIKRTESEKRRREREAISNT